MIPSIALSIYLGFTHVADGFANRLLSRRLAAGKEDPDRVDERSGKSMLPRPDGPLVWFHAASIGESMSILELLRTVRETFPDINVLVTTGTRTSASMLDLRLPEGVIHQFVPVDTKTAVTRFLDHWQPDVAIWTESEFWPRLMIDTARRGAKMVLINGRISSKTRRKWMWLRGMSRRLMREFDLLLVQSADIAANFRAIGAPADRVLVTGSLKEGAVPLPDIKEERSAIAAQIGRRPVWLAASTHEGEEVLVAAAQKRALRKNPELLLILAPRHPERGNALAQVLRANGLKLSQRSVGEEIGSETQVYLADTLGELGIWYRLSPVSFVGGSLQDIGGHNPFEPAALGSAIIHGPFVSSFADIYQRLSDGAATIRVESDAELADAVQRCLSPDQAARFASAAWAVSSEGSGVTDAVFDHLRPYLSALAPAQDAPDDIPDTAATVRQ